MAAVLHNGRCQASGNSAPFAWAFKFGVSAGVRHLDIRLEELLGKVRLQPAIAPIFLSDYGHIWAFVVPGYFRLSSALRGLLKVEPMLAL